MNVDPSFFLGAIVAAVGAAAYFHVYVDNYVKKTKEDTCKEIDKDIISLKQDVKETSQRVEMLYGKVARLKEALVQERSEKDHIWRIIFDLYEDNEEIFAKQKMTRRKRTASNFADFKSRIPDISFDTLDDDL